MAKAPWYDPRLNTVDFSKVYKAQVGFVATDSKGKPFYGLYSDQIDFNENEIFLHSEALKDPRYRDIELPDSLELNIRIQPVLTGEEGDLFLDNERSKPDPATRDKRAANLDKGWRLNVTNVMIPPQSKVILDQMIGNPAPAATQTAGAGAATTIGPTPATIAGPSNPVGVQSKSDPTRPVKLEIYGTPIGGENGSRWKISFEVEGRDGNRLVPVEDVSVRLEHHSGALKGVTDKDGCFSGEIEINENEYARGYVNAVLSISNIPLAGPENAQQQRKQKTGFARWNNWLFLVVFLIVVSALIYNLYAAVSYLSTPFGQSQSGAHQQTRKERIDYLLDFDRNSVEQKTVQPTQPVLSLPAQIWLWITFPLPYGSWFVWLIWFAFMVILIPICFYDEAHEAALAVYQRSKQGLDLLFHTRRAFRVGIEEMPDGNTKMIVNGQDSEGLKTKKEAIGEVAAMSIKQLFAKVAIWDFALELAYKAVGGLVKTIFGGR